MNLRRNAVHEVEIRLKKRFRVQWSVKKVRPTVFSDMKRPMSIDFLEKDATVYVTWAISPRNNDDDNTINKGRYAIKQKIPSEREASSNN